MMRQNWRKLVARYMLGVVALGLGVSSPVVATESLCQQQVQQVNASTQTFPPLLMAWCKDSVSVKKLYAAGPPAEVLLYALAPDRMVGWSTKRPLRHPEYLGQGAENMPVYGGINGHGTTVSLEKLVADHVDVIVDVGQNTAYYQGTAQRTFEQTHIPYVLVDGTLAQTPNQIKALAQFIQIKDDANLLDAAQQALRFAQGRQASNRGKKVYYARGPSGLETAGKGSIHTEVIDILGATNVGDSLGNVGSATVSLEQILLWNPDIIITQDPAFLEKLKTDTTWQKIPAVARGKVYLMPSIPFGWVDGPPGINRLLGLYALDAALQNKPITLYKDPIKQLYFLLYHRELSDSLFDGLLH